MLKVPEKHAAAVSLSEPVPWITVAETDMQLFTVKLNARPEIAEATKCADVMQRL